MVIQEFLKPEYLEVFKDSFFACFLFSFSKELALPLIFYFKTYNNLIATIMAYFGSVLGLMVTYFCCLVITISLKKYTDNANSRAFAYYYNKTSPLLFAVAMIPQANVVVSFFAGFLRMNWVKTLVLIAVYRAIYYACFYNYPDYFLNRM